MAVSKNLSYRSICIDAQACILDKYDNQGPGAGTTREYCAAMENDAVHHTHIRAGTPWRSYRFGSRPPQ